MAVVRLHSDSIDNKYTYVGLGMLNSQTGQGADVKNTWQCIVLSTLAVCSGIQCDMFIAVSNSYTGGGGGGSTN